MTDPAINPFDIEAQEQAAEGATALLARRPALRPKTSSG
jgi:hypothetical protein